METNGTQPFIYPAIIFSNSLILAAEKTDLSPAAWGFETLKLAHSVAILGLMNSARN